MTAKEEARCLADGRLAFREKVEMEQCPRRGAAQRAAWLRGFEHEQKLAASVKATAAQRAESRNVISRLKDWATENLK